jgi:hypothetical protein
MSVRVELTQPLVFLPVLRFLEVLPLILSPTRPAVPALQRPSSTHMDCASRHDNRYTHMASYWFGRGLYLQELFYLHSM